MQGNLLFDYPRHIRLEIHRGCNRRCKFCGIQSTSKINTQMSPETFNKAILPNIQPELRRLDFAMHGEPLMNPNILDYVAALRTKHSKLQISILSNADYLSSYGNDFLLRLFDAGLNFFHTDLYNSRAEEKFLTYLRSNKEQYKSNNIRILDFYRSRVNPWSYRGPDAKYILLCSENNREDIITRRLHNVGGNMDYSYWKKVNKQLQDLPSTDKCIEPFKSAAIISTGELCLCCVDWSRSCILADLNNTTLYDAWNSEFINKIRYALHHGRRDIIPTCMWCDKKCFRVGLYQLPKHIRYNMAKLKEEFKTIPNIAQHELLKEKYNEI